MKRDPWILGVSCSHNGSACLLHGSDIVAAIQDERLLRFKRVATTGRFVNHSVRYCLDAGGIQPHQLDLVVYSTTRGDIEKELHDVFLNDALRIGHFRIPAVGIPHHYAHAVSAFATSGFERAAVLVVDGSGTLVERLPPDERKAVINRDVKDGDWEWLSYYEAVGATIRPVMKQVGRSGEVDQSGIECTGSLGNMYGAVGLHLFGDFFEGPGKVMGLAPYGDATIPVDEWLTVDSNGLVTLNSGVYRSPHVQCQWPSEFEKCANLAASAQRAIEYALLRIVAAIRSQSQGSHLCYAGGVALNSVANELIVRNGGFENVFIFPAAEDSGVAVGAAYHGLWLLSGAHAVKGLRCDSMGRAYTSDEISRAVAVAPGLHAGHDQRWTPRDVVRELIEGKILGWFLGGSELGPRSLGQRTILCDPRRDDAKATLNLRVKHREAFRPFAPVVLREHVEEWFDVPPQFADSPFMLRVWRFRPGRASAVPAVAHVDGTGRVQTITRDTHPALYDVIEEFRKETGVPMLLNTSFNIAGAPIVETPEDALWCVLSTQIDGCVFDDRIVHRPPELASLLALRPHVIAKAITVEMPVNDGRVDWFQHAEPEPDTRRWMLRPFHPLAIGDARTYVRSAGRVPKPFAYAATESRWGETVVLLTGSYLQLLTMIDGKTDGYGLLQHGPRWSEEWLVRALSDLQRASLIWLEGATDVSRTIALRHETSLAYSPVKK